MASNSYRFVLGIMTAILIVKTYTNMAKRSKFGVFEVPADAHILNIADGGARLVARSDSMAAFTLAADIGADGVHSFLHLTRDGHLVLGRENDTFSSSDLADIQTSVSKSSAALQRYFTDGLGLMSLCDAVEYSKSQNTTRLFLEVPKDVVVTEEWVDAALKCLKSYSAWMPPVLTLIGDRQQLAGLKSVKEQANYGMLSLRTTNATDIKDLGVDSIAVPYTMLTKEIIEGVFEVFKFPRVLVLDVVEIPAMSLLVDVPVLGIVSIHPHVVGTYISSVRRSVREERQFHVPPRQVQ